jgi:hypothetical protein
MRRHWNWCSSSIQVRCILSEIYIRNNLLYYSGCVMNLITCDKAYSIFPRATFEERRSLIFERDNRKVILNNKDTDLVAKSREKYEKHGWSFIEAYEILQQDPLSSFAKGYRYLGDSNCWSITLHPEHERVNGTCKSSTWESNSWELVYENGQTPKNVWMLLRNPLFHWSYLICLRLMREEGRDVFIEVGENQ